MPNIRTFSRSFVGGEVTPEFYGQIADAKFQTGLALCRNYIVLPHGPITNRPGTRFVKATKTAAKRARVIPFVYSNTQTFAIEMGDGYLRFHTSGATLQAGSPAAYNGATAYTVGNLVSSGGVSYYCIAPTTGNAPPNATYWYALPADGTYEIPTPYAEADLFAIHYVQSQDVLTIVHPSYAPRELRRYGATDWRLVTVGFASDLASPGSIAATATTGSGSTTYRYTVTAVDSTGREEGLAGTPDDCTNNLLTTGNKNTITWAAVSGASRYNVYKQDNGLYGYIGQTDELSFVDENITADLSKTPPIQNTPFTGSDNYPAAATYFEQRRSFGGTNNKPQNFWLTRTGTESSMSYSIPTRADDAIAYRISARERNVIKHLVPLNGSLLALTSSAEFGITSTDSGAITAETTSIRPQSYVGANDTQPLVINNTMLFAAARGGHMREMGYNWQAQGYLTGDLSLRAPHLFDNYDIVDMAYAKAPYPVVWSVSSSGKLLGMTYIPEQQVGPWHQHDSYTGDGAHMSAFESVCVVPEGSEDAVYAILKRRINGADVRYVERFSKRHFAVAEDAFFVDCGVTYDGAPVDVISSGLSHLEGEVVNILIDGAVHPQRTVTGGTINLDVEGSVIHIGLPITSDAQTLPLVLEISGAGQGRQKNVNKVWMRVYESSGIYAGPDFDHLTLAKQRTTEPYGSPPALKSGEVAIVVTPSWGDSGQLCIRQSDPLPITITSLSLEVAIGG